jgi:hypothetical protein
MFQIFPRHDEAPLYSGLLPHSALDVTFTRREHDCGVTQT